jgi:hypothetical protein
MTDLTGQPPVTAVLENSDATSNIYVTQDPTVNQLTLTLTAAQGVDVQLPAGSPVQYGDLPSGQSAVYVYFDALLANQEIQQIHFTAPGWTANTFTDPSSTLQYLVIAPNTDVTLAGDGPLTFCLTNVLVAEQPISGTGDVVLAGVTGISTDDADLAVYLNIADPPQPKNKVLDDSVVDIGFDDTDLYTGQPDTLVLHLINRTDQPLVPGGGGAWGSSPPTFTLTVLYGDRVGDLTALGNAQDITGTILNDYGNVWKQVGHQDQGQKRSWYMQPDKNGGGTVLGTGEQATIEFSFSPIVVTLPAGLDHAFTVAYLSWSGVPGYNDGSLGIPITKRAGPSITTFTADPGIVPYGATSLQTVLTWAVANADADSVTFDVPGVPPDETFHSSGTGPIEGGVTVPTGTALGITAYKTIDSGQISTSATLVLPEVKRTDVPVTVTGLPRFVVLPPGVTGYVFDGGGTSCTEVNLASMAITRTWDLGAAAQSPLQLTGVIGVTASPDGSRLHVAATDENSNPWLLAVDPVARTVTQQVSLGTLKSDQVAEAATLAPSPDGATLYLSSLVQTSGSGGGLEPYALQLIDAATYGVTTTYLWGDTAAVGAVAAGGVGGMLFVDTVKGPAVLETAGGVRVTSQLDLADDYELLPFPPSVATADRSTFYVVTADLTTFDKTTKIAELALAVVRADPRTGALSVASKVLLGLEVDTGAEYFAEIVGWWAGGIVALSQDEKILYFLYADTSIGVITLADMSVQVWGCDPKVFLAFPLATGPQEGVVYAMQGTALSVISVGRPATQRASPAATVAT